MATQITVTYKGEKYTLEYTRLTARAVESQGFVLDDISTKSVLTVNPKLLSLFIYYAGSGYDGRKPSVSERRIFFEMESIKNESAESTLS